MKRTALRFLMFLIIGLAWYGQKYGNKPSNINDIKTEEKLIYTKHAVCRMNCRKISKADINNTLQLGSLNEKKSEPNAKPCPKYAYEWSNSEREDLRVIIAYCEDASKIITAINLDREFNCNCS